MKQRCINVLITKVYKHLNGYSPDLLNEIFYLRQDNYNLNFNDFGTDNSLNKYLLNSSVYRANQLWKTLLSKIKDCASLQLFKNKIFILKIKTWSCNRYLCQDLLKIYCQCLLSLLCFSVTPSLHELFRLNRRDLLQEYLAINFNS